MTMLLEDTSKANIKAWQTFLNQQNDGAIAEDGRWGPESIAATKQFQRQHGLTADGLVGPGTIATAEARGFTFPDPLDASAFDTPPHHTNNVFDIAHGNTVHSGGFQAAYQGGMRLVFHKATGGFTTVNYHDDRYAERRPLAERAGLLWGAYHFANGYESGEAQASGFLNFLDNHGGIEHTLMVLDYEPDTDGKAAYSSMHLDQARGFVSHIYSETGIYPGLYGAHNKLIADLVAAQVPADNVLYQCWLWYVHYSHRPPALSSVHWKDYTFWQYAAEHAPDTPGMAGKVDRSFYNLNMGALEDFHRAHVVGKER